MEDELNELAARVTALEEKVDPQGTRHLTLKQAAQALGVHYNTAYAYVRDGTVKASKVGGRWRINPEHLEALHEQ